MNVDTVLFGEPFYFGPAFWLGAVVGVILSAIVFFMWYSEKKEKIDEWEKWERKQRKKERDRR